MATPGQIIFTKHYDESGNVAAVTADGFPEEIEIGARLLEDADPRLLSRHGNRVRLTVQNGEAVYVLLTDKPDVSGRYHAGRLFYKERTNGSMAKHP